MSHTVQGHPFLNEKNHASKGIKKTMDLGGGGRFAALKSKLLKQSGVTDPGGLAAAIGRAKYGNKKMTAMAKAGKKG